MPEVILTKFDEFVLVSSVIPQGSFLVGYYDNGTNKTNIQVPFSSIIASIPPADTQSMGVTVYASQVETNAGSINNKAISPVTLTTYTEPFTADEKTKLDGLVTYPGFQTAAETDIVDSGGYYTSGNVEGALQEVGLSLTNKLDVGATFVAADITNFDTAVTNSPSVVSLLSTQASTSNPNSVYLEQARAVNNQLSGDINFNNHTGINVKDPVNPQDIVNFRTLNGLQYFYIAFADASDGTGFTLTNDPTKSYVAFLVSSVPIPSPIQANFNGLWRRINTTGTYFGNYVPNGTTPAGAVTGAVFFSQPDPVDGIIQNITVYQRDDIAWQPVLTIFQDGSSNIIGGPSISCKIFKSAVQSIPNTTNTVVSFDNEQGPDPFNIHSDVTNNSRLTVPVGGGGDYTVSAQIAFPNTFSGGFVDATIVLSGTTVLGRIKENYPAGTEFINLTAGVTHLLEGQYVELYVSQTTGGSINIIQGLSGTWLSLTNSSAKGDKGDTGAPGVTGPIKVDQGGTLESERSEINFIAGSNVTISVVDNPGASRADITINSTAGATSGQFGIANSSGAYTFYSTFQAAITAASSGQSVEMFADITESTNTEVILKNGVNIEGHGHTYILSNAGTANALTDNASAVNCLISNLVVSRQLGANSVLNSASIKLSNSSTNIKCSGVIFKNTVGTGGIIINSMLTGAVFETQGTAVIGSSSCQLIEVKGLATAGNGINLGVGGRATLCYGSSTSGGFEGIVSDGVLRNSAGFSSTGYGINNTSNGLCFNCTGSSTADRGIFSNGECSNSVGYSTASFGFQQSGKSSEKCTGNSTANSGIALTSNGVLYSCTAIATTAAAMFVGGPVYKCNAICQFNDPSGHAILINGSPSPMNVFKTYMEVSNSSANCINGTATVKFGQNTNNGATTFKSAGITQGESNVPDAQGNINI